MRSTGRSVEVRPGAHLPEPGARLGSSGNIRITTTRKTTAAPATMTAWSAKYVAGETRS
jgi:hypothetical protein